MAWLSSAPLRAGISPVSSAARLGAQVGDGDEGLGEGHAGARQPLHVRRADPAIAVDARVELILIVGQEDDDVRRRGGAGGPAGGEDAGQTDGDEQEGEARHGAAV